MIESTGEDPPIDRDPSVHPTIPYTFHSKRLDPVTRQPLEVVIKVPFTPDEMDALAQARELQSGEDSPIVKSAVAGSGFERDFLVDLRLPWSQMLTDREAALQRMREASQYAAGVLQLMDENPNLNNPDLRQAFEGIISLVSPLANPEGTVS